MAAASHDYESGEEEGASSASGVSCHSHAGVEHCVDAEGNTVSSGCARPDYQYDIPLRIGLLFVILCTGAIGVLGPIFTAKFSKFDADHIVLVCLRQFGTGIIISTALVHLYTHAQLFFSNECLGRLQYEATTSAVVMAALFVTFLIEYIAQRLQRRKSTTQGRPAALHDHKMPQAAADDSSEEERRIPGSATEKELMVQVTVMEAGIIFHSILIGLTLVVANDSGFISLFIVILFHQMFEGIALGSRIAMTSAGLARKIVMALGFAITTPIGMAIGIGVLSSFNGNDPSTIVAIATLDAFSAGILLWVGLVGMLFSDWWFRPLATSGAVKTALGMLFLVSGLVLMSLLGKWA
ncbi:high-affinity Zn(2+) transporter zrt1 [Saxophila tyrrhenica]|uniref:High-affinity Zn(2+) transporter zrt1 n=1 Tax=Saxophila tyrrhenica TaxID=1690608 RepID=A0AAV9P4P9_9PEZI|nr:high-affinity Zn(2+) transporter zrt1 [Saxophila tyrrhenica]